MTKNDKNDKKWLADLFAPHEVAHKSASEDGQRLAVEVGGIVAANLPSKLFHISGTKSG
jgi:hypothetical protein